MTPQQAAVELIRRREARRSLLPFIKYTTPGYEDAWFHRYVCRRLTEAATQKNQRIIVRMRPRGGKSEIISRNYPAFLYGNDPNHKIIACTHTAALSEKLNRAVQRKILSQPYRELFPGISIGSENIVTKAGQPIRNSSEIEVLSKHGEVWQPTGLYRNAGVGSAIAGEGADTLLLDDYLPDTEAAESVTIREKQKDWYSGDFYTRKAPGANIIILATQRHEDDLIGWLISTGKKNPEGDQWEVISFPNECDYKAANEEQPEYDTREEGELLWPERFGPEEAAATRIALGPYLYSALYQCRPTAREGNAIKRTDYVITYSFEPSDIVSIALYYDIGFSDAPESDWTWGSLKAKMKDGTFLTLWQHFGKWNSNARNIAVREFGLQLQQITKAGLIPSVPIKGEAGIGGSVDVVKEWRNQLIAAGLNAATVPSKGSKVSRATAQKDSYLAAVSAQRVKLYAGNAFADYGLCDGMKHWINPFLSAVAQLRFSDNGLEFVGGKDDMLDAETGAHNSLNMGQKTEAASQPIIFY